MSTDIWLRTGLTLTAVASAAGATVTLEDAEDHWEWVLADLDGTIIDLTRTHTLPPASTDTRIFRYDTKPFSIAMRQDLVDRLTAAGIVVAGGPGLSTVAGRLADPDPKVRERAADEAGDFFRGRISDQAETEAAVAKLVAAAVDATEERVRESALNACSDATSHYELPLALFEPLVPVLPGLSPALIGYVLQILGSTHDPAAQPFITPCLTHTDLSVRGEASEALVELGIREQ